MKKRNIILTIILFIALICICILFFLLNKKDDYKNNLSNTTSSNTFATTNKKITSEAIEDVTSSTNKTEDTKPVGTTKLIKNTKQSTSTTKATESKTIKNTQSSNDGTYYKLLPFYTIVSEEEARNNRAITTFKQSFYYHIAKVDKVNGEITNIVWKFSSSKTHNDTLLANAKKYIQSPPNSLEESIEIYNQNPDIHWGEKTLYWVAAVSE